MSFLDDCEKILRLDEEATPGWELLPPPNKEAVVFIPAKGGIKGDIVFASPGWAEGSIITTEEELKNCEFAVFARSFAPKAAKVIDELYGALSMMVQGQHMGNPVTGDRLVSAAQLLDKLKNSNE